MAGSNVSDFVKALGGLDISHTERAVATIWWFDKQVNGCFVSIGEIAAAFEDAGHARQNRSRLAKQLTKDRRVRKGARSKFGLNASARTKLDGTYRSYANHKVIIESDSVIPRELFWRTRGYLEKVVRQINASYDYGLFDGCAVMCRRLLETLLIETYESKGWAIELKNADGHYKMFSGLLAHVKQESRFTLGRNALDGLSSFKSLGDKSAHDRRFNARKPDIDRIRDGLRAACEDLLHLSDLSPKEI